VRLVVGLGNPGRRYAATRHNVAWQVVDELIRRWCASEVDSPPSYRAWEAKVGGRAVSLVKPLTFMNRSGEALEAWREGPQAPAEDMLVIVDDVYLPVGTLRLRAGGSSAGHRGLESIAHVLGHGGFARLRLGVGAAESSATLREHVLDRFSADDRALVDDAALRSADAVECWVTEGITSAMNRFNRKAGKEVREP